jgi:glutamyl-tRNA synthetase
MNSQQQKSLYRGRIAPTPTGYLHLGHASTFKIAETRARKAGGTVIFRNEDLDAARCKQEFIDASFKDLKDIGLTWDEGPEIGGDFGPYSQSERITIYKGYWKRSS